MTRSNREDDCWLLNDRFKYAHHTFADSSEKLIHSIFSIVSEGVSLTTHCQFGSQRLWIINSEGRIHCWSSLKVYDCLLNLQTYGHFSRSVDLFMRIGNLASAFSKHFTVQKMMFSINHFFSKCDQIRRKLRLVSFTEEIDNSNLHFLCCVLKKKWK